MEKFNGTAGDLIDKRVRQMRAKDKHLSYHEAMTKVLADDKQLRDEYVFDRVVERSIRHESPGGGPAKFEKLKSFGLQVHDLVVAQKLEQHCSYEKALEMVLSDPTNRELKERYAAEGQPVPVRRFDGAEDGYAPKWGTR